MVEGGNKRISRNLLGRMCSNVQAILKPSAEDVRSREPNVQAKADLDMPAQKGQDARFSFGDMIAILCPFDDKRERKMLEQSIKLRPLTKKDILYAQVFSLPVIEIMHALFLHLPPLSR